MGQLKVTLVLGIGVSKLQPSRVADLGDQHEILAPLFQTGDSSGFYTCARLR
jgi:hypothetical protein